MILLFGLFLVTHTNPCVFISHAPRGSGANADVLSSHNMLAKCMRLLMVLNEQHRGSYAVYE